MMLCILGLLLEMGVVGQRTSPLTEVGAPYSGRSLRYQPNLFSTDQHSVSTLPSCSYPKKSSCPESFPAFPAVVHFISCKVCSESLPSFCLSSAPSLKYPTNPGPVMLKRTWNWELSLPLQKRRVGINEFLGVDLSSMKPLNQHDCSPLPPNYSLIESRTYIAH